MALRRRLARDLRARLVLCGSSERHSASAEDDETRTSSSPPCRDTSRAGARPRTTRAARRRGAVRPPPGSSAPPGPAAWYTASPSASVLGRDKRAVAPNASGDTPAPVATGQVAASRSRSDPRRRGRPTRGGDGPRRSDAQLRRTRAPPAEATRGRGPGRPLRAAAATPRGRRSRAGTSR
jgi:hypothetical protein